MEPMIAKCVTMQTESLHGLSDCLDRKIEREKLVQKHLDLNDSRISDVKKALEDKKTSKDEKQYCELTFAYLTSIADSLNSLISKRTLVKWIPIKISKNKYIKVGIIKNLGHLLINQFFDDAFGVFQQKINKILQKEDIIYVYIIMLLNYHEAISFDRDKGADLCCMYKYFNTPTLPVSVVTDLKDWYKINVKEFFLKQKKDFKVNENCWPSGVSFLKIYVSENTLTHTNFKKIYYITKKNKQI